MAFKRLIAVSALTVLALFIAPAVASAHATLSAAGPAAGGRLPVAPTQVSLTFDEPVETAPDSVRVFGPDGARVDAGGATHGLGGSPNVIVALRFGLRHGTYTVAWRVISADSHPVSGAYTFSIGAPSSTAVSAASLAAQGGSRVVGVLFGVARWVAFAAFALLVGTSVFLFVCWPSGRSHLALRRLVSIGWWGLLGSSVAGLLLQGVYGTGLGLGSALDGRIIRATLDSRFGVALTVRLFLLGLFRMYVPLLFARARGTSRAALAAGGALLSVGLAATWAAAGHASVGIQVPLALLADTTHLLAMACWLGGLVVLGTVLLRRESPKGSSNVSEPLASARRDVPPRAEVVTAVNRFSRLAFGCVTALAATGFYQAWRGVGTWQALATTPYGRLLLMKMAGFTALIMLGARARRLLSRRLIPVPARQAIPVAAGLGRYGGRSPAKQSESLGLPVREGPAEPPSTSMHVDLRRGVLAEIVLGGAVLVAAAVLVNAAPARAVPAAANPPAHAHGSHAHGPGEHPPLETRTAAFDTHGVNGAGRVTAIVDPAGAGANALYIEVRDPRGRLRRVPEVDAEFTLPARQLGPLRAQLTPAGTGHYVANPVIIPAQGDWRLAITIRTSDIDDTTVVVPIKIN